MFVETIPRVIDKFMSTNGTLVLEKLPILAEVSKIYCVNHQFNLSIINS